MNAQPLDPRALEFAAGLPDAYSNSFDTKAILAHKRISDARGAASVNVGSFVSSRIEGTAICVVADDRPGLLATLSAALVARGLDVLEGEAYTRKRVGRCGEAVDVFWIRYAEPSRHSERVSEEEICCFGEVLHALLEGKQTFGKLPILRAESEPRLAGVPTVVRFIEGAQGQFSTLEVETGDRSGLLWAISQALFQQKIQILSSHVKSQAGRVFDRFQVVELDGAPISPKRRLEVQVAVLSALDSIFDGPAP